MIRFERSTLSFACKDRREFQNNQNCEQYLKYMPPNCRLNMLFFFSFDFDFVAGGSVIFLLLLIIIIAIALFGMHEEVTHFPGVDKHSTITQTSCGLVEG